MHIGEWLAKLAEEEQEKTAAAELETLFEHMSVADVLKIAQSDGKMSQERREGLPSKSFAVPESKAKKIGVAGEIKGEAKGKYPIPDEKHARNALARVSQHGTPAEREAVRKKVYSKFPGLREGFEESHGGESPTSKENVKKVEQGGIGKEAMVRLQFMDKVARQIARTHHEVEKTAAENVKPGTRYKTEGKKRKVKVLDKYYRFKQGVGEHKGLRTGLGAITGAAAAAASAARRGKKTGVPALVGAGVGAGLGRISAHFSKRRRQAISGMGEKPKWHGQSESKTTKTKVGMAKCDAFTTPEAQAKAKVMRRAMKASKGAPPNVMKSAIKMTAKQVRSV